ncbi:D-inositol-3-phosphate glycosyltransferase [Paramicrobacterium humi]|uniref:D-inositol-3-phosphate glycosyltransferase n=1 Tax=Paramicrobacterium humi TaxID=640635 RepID=A0A1H4KRS1_9MICO|nr:glycosyltransferase [Microbacterium humi]SEB60798.1 D-inositol-3-phosphate glycosyltransferase [Microbacterium humi]
MPLRLALVSLHTSPNDDPGTGDVGGMNVAVRHTALALAELGHEIDVLTRRSSTAGPDACEVAPGVTLRQLSAGPAERRVKGDHEEYIEAFRAAMADLGPYDLIHSHHWFSGMAAVEIARSRGIPHVQSYHSIAAALSTPLSEGERPESPGRLAGEAALAAASDAIITVSDAERSTVIDRLGAEPQRVVTVYPGVDANQFAPDSRSDAATVSPGYIVAAARLEPLKGLDLAIETLAGSRDPELRLVVSGGPTTGHDDYPAELEQLARDRSVADRVEFIGPQGRDALAALLRGARTVLVPSHSETFGLIALEAQSCGVPVLAADAGGLREAIADGETGVLVPARDPARWAAELDALLADSQRARVLGEAGRTRALQFTWRRTAEQTAAVYERVLAGGLA